MNLTLSLATRLAGWDSSRQQRARVSMIERQATPAMVAPLPRPGPDRRDAAARLSRDCSRAGESAAELRFGAPTGVERGSMSCFPVSSGSRLPWSWSVFLCGVVPKSIQGAADFSFGKSHPSQGDRLGRPMVSAARRRLASVARRLPRHTAPRSFARPPNFVAIAATKYPRAGSARKLVVGLSRS
jgi:hypothetical protein